MIRITYEVTEQAQREALARGEHVALTQTLEVPATPALAALAKIAADGTATISCGDTWFGRGGTFRRLFRAGGDQYDRLEHAADHVLAAEEVEPWIAAQAALVEARARELATADAERVAQQEREAAEQAARTAAEETEREAAMAATIAALETAPSPAIRDGGWITGEIPGLLGGHGDGYRVPETLRPRLAALRAREEKRLVAEAVATLEALAALAARHGDQSVRERIAAGQAPLGLLPEDEAREIVRDAVLPVNDGLRPCVRLVREDLVMERDETEDASESEEGWEPCSDPQYQADVAEEASAAEWQAVTATRAALAARGLPVGELHRHQGWCGAQRCPRHGRRAARASRLGLLVRVEAAPGLWLSREYAV